MLRCPGAIESFREDARYTARRALSPTQGNDRQEVVAQARIAALTRYAAAQVLTRDPVEIPNEHTRRDVGLPRRATRCADPTLAHALVGRLLVHRVDGGTCSRHRKYRASRRNCPDARTTVGLRRRGHRAAPSRLFPLTRRFPARSFRFSKVTQATTTPSLGDSALAHRDGTSIPPCFSLRVDADDSGRRPSIR